MSFLSGVRETTKALDELVEVGAAAVDELERLAAINVPGPTLLDSAGRRITGPPAKGQILGGTPPPGQQATSSTSPDYHTGLGGTGGPFHAGPRPLSTGAGATFGRSTKLIRSGLDDPEKIIFISYDGTLQTTLKFIQSCIRIGTCQRTMIPIPGVSLPIEMFDLTVAMADARALFPVIQGDFTGGRSVGASGGGGGAGGSGSGSGRSRTGAPPSPPPSSFPAPPTYLPGSQNTAPGKIQVVPPTEPTPGERAIVAAIREEFSKSRAQARNDGGTTLRAQGLG